MDYCSFSNKDAFEKFLGRFQQKEYVTRMRLDNLYSKATEETVLSPHVAEIINYSPLKHLHINISRSSISKIIIDAKTLETLFSALSTNKLEYLYMYLEPKVNEATSVE